MKLSDLDQRFVGRLENWGRFYRDQRRPGQSATYRVCQQLALAAGQNMHEGFREVSPAPEVDEDDARIIEWCWTQAKVRMDAKHWALLRAHFVMRHDPRGLCRAMQIRRLSYESEVAAAVHRFQDLVGVMEGCTVAQSAR